METMKKRNEFLKENGFLEEAKDGTLVRANRAPKCSKNHKEEMIKSKKKVKGNKKLKNIEISEKVWKSKAKLNIPFGRQTDRTFYSSRSKAAQN